MTLGNRIKESLEARGATQVALAEAVGISKQAVSALISGASTKTSNLFEIASFLGVDPTWLKTGEGTPGEGVVDPEEALLIARFRKASPAVRKAILAVSELSN